MENVSMLTVIPVNLAKELCERKSIHEYNTMPQIEKRVLEGVKEFMSEEVGYSEFPIACFGLPNRDVSLNSVEDLLTYLPMNNKESVLFKLVMPNDMIVSADFNTLLEASNDVKSALGDEEEIEYILDDLKDALKLGLSEDTSNEIIFIPFLDFNRCKFYACFDDRFSTGRLDLPGIAKTDIRKLTSFM